MYPSINRDSLAKIYGVSQGFLGYLLREKKIPLPVSIGGEILWYEDEVNKSLPQVTAFLEKRRKNN